MPRWGDSYAPGAAEPTLYVLPLPARPWANIVAL